MKEKEKIWFHLPIPWHFLRTTPINCLHDDKGQQCAISALNIGFQKKIIHGSASSRGLNIQIWGSCHFFQICYNNDYIQFNHSIDQPSVDGWTLSHFLVSQLQYSSPRVIKKVFSVFLNSAVSTTSWTVVGNRFHIFGATHEKALLPYPAGKTMWRTLGNSDLHHVENTWKFGGK